MDQAIIDSENEPVLLAHIQSLLKENQIFALLVRSTDRYFNEYVPKSESIRTRLTGFDGSVGDAIITTDSAHLFVDGRYTLQAKAQAKGFRVHQCQSSQSIEATWMEFLKEVLKPNDVLAYDPSTIDLRLFDRLDKNTSGLKAKIRPDAQNFFARLLDFASGQKNVPNMTVFTVKPDLCGQTPEEKLAILAPILRLHDVDGFLSVKLDDIAWLTNLRSLFFPFQTVIPGILCVHGQGMLFGINSSFRGTVNSTKQLEIVDENEIFQAIRRKFNGSRFILGIDRGETSKA
ncbi:MAG TPA: aminopeptidase P family N-terminal domain-containing protein, partial [Myxococcota bacterium]|nr:aminopeptidase P family N-terminal domain-containing protein [Myxococcota bacterium]